MGLPHIVHVARTSELCSRSHVPLDPRSALVAQRVRLRAAPQHTDDDIDANDGGHGDADARHDARHGDTGKAGIGSGAGNRIATRKLASYNFVRKRQSRAHRIVHGTRM